MMNYRVIIAGGRTFADYDLVKTQCLALLKERMNADNVIIVSGCASGADALGERFAREHNLVVELHPADWERHGRSAGPIRNAEMADVADALIAFWDGKSRGTKSMIEIARRKGIPVKCVKC